MIILLDGSKGAGKSTTAKLLCDVLNNSVSLSIDSERALLVNQEEKTIQERNKEAFEILLHKCSSFVDEDKTVVIDCGLIAERVLQMEKLAEEKSVSLHKFLLKASYDTQLERVRERDTLKGKETDVDRFKKIHDSLHSKSFEDFISIETDKNNPEEVVNMILSNIV
ncbi:MAG: AAA family ATPase [Candidatus Paceibacterota bacterium]